jgi:hypothetical protein
MPAVSLTNNIAVAQGVVDGGMDFRVKLFEASFRTDGDITIPTSGGGGAEMYMNQTIATAGQTFQQDGVNGNARQRIDQVQGTNPGKFTYASIDGAAFMPTAGRYAGWHGDAGAGLCLDGWHQRGVDRCGSAG